MTVCAAGTLTGPASAQGRPTLEIARESGPSMTVPVSLDRGYAVVPITIFEALGWTVSEEGGGVELSAADDATSPAAPCVTRDCVVMPEVRSAASAKRESENNGAVTLPR